MHFIKFRCQAEVFGKFMGVGLKHLQNMAIMVLQVAKEMLAPRKVKELESLIEFLQAAHASFSFDC